MPSTLTAAQIKWLQKFFMTKKSDGERPSASALAGPVASGPTPPGPIAAGGAPQGPVDDGSAPTGPVDDGSMSIEPDPAPAPAAHAPAKPSVNPSPAPAVPADDGSSPSSPLHPYWQAGYDTEFYGPDDAYPVPAPYNGETAQAYQAGVAAAQSEPFGGRQSERPPKVPQPAPPVPPAAPRAPPAAPPAPKLDPGLTAHPELKELDARVRDQAQFIATPYGELVTLGSPAVAKLVSDCLHRLEGARQLNANLEVQIPSEEQKLKPVEAYLKSPSSLQQEVAARKSDLAVLAGKQARSSKKALEALGDLVNALTAIATLAAAQLRAAKGKREDLKEKQEIKDLERDIEDAAKRQDRNAEYAEGGFKTVVGTAEENPAEVAEGVSKIVLNLWGRVQDEIDKGKLKDLEDRANQLENHEAAEAIELAEATVKKFEKLLAADKPRLEDLKNDYEQDLQNAEDVFDKAPKDKEIPGGGFKFEALYSAIDAVKLTLSTAGQSKDYAEFAEKAVWDMVEGFAHDYLYNYKTNYESNPSAPAVSPGSQTEINNGIDVQRANQPIFKAMLDVTKRWIAAGDDAVKHAMPILEKLNQLRTIAVDAQATTVVRHKR